MTPLAGQHPKIDLVSTRCQLNWKFSERAQINTCLKFSTELLPRKTHLGSAWEARRLAPLAVSGGAGALKDLDRGTERACPPNGAFVAELRRVLGRGEPGSAQLLSVPLDLSALRPLASGRSSLGTLRRQLPEMID